MNVLVADDQAISREGLTTILEALDGVTVVGAAADGAEAVEMVGRHPVDVVLMDLRMPGMDGVQAIRRLSVSQPQVAVVVLTTYTDDTSILDALNAGAAGYLTKNATAGDIRRALEAAVSGQTVLDHDVHARLLDRATGGAGAQVEAGALPAGLSAREAEVLALVARGLSNAEIAERLFLSRTTIKTHINQILRKTGCRDRPQAIVFAFEHDLRVPE